MTEDAHFRAWVANTVHSISGIWCLDWRGLERKRALTTAEISAVACQEVLARKFQAKNSGLMRGSQLVTANVIPIHRNRH